MTPADVSSDASQSLLYHLTNSYQTSMSAAHPPHRANKRAREESTDDSPKRLFIGRACCPPFVFALGEGMTATNREWLRSGSVNEMDYDAETRQFFSAQARDDNTHGGSASKGSRASSQSDLSDGWSRRQEVFLWKAQVSIRSDCSDQAAPIRGRERMGKGSQDRKQGRS